MTAILTQKQLRDRAIFDEYNALIGEGKHSRTGVVQRLMHKYHIYSPATIYAVIKRVGQEEGGQS